MGAFDRVPDFGQIDLLNVSRNESLLKIRVTGQVIIDPEVAHVPRDEYDGLRIGLLNQNPDELHSEEAFNLATVRVAEVDADFNFHLAHAPDGTYWVAGGGDLQVDGQKIDIHGAHGDETGPQSIAITDGVSHTGVDVAMRAYRMDGPPGELRVEYVSINGQVLQEGAANPGPTGIPSPENISVFYFGTEVPAASVSGHVAVDAPAGFQPLVSFAGIKRPTWQDEDTRDAYFTRDHDDPGAGSVRTDFIGPDGAFNLPLVPDGEYHLFAFVGGIDHLGRWMSLFGGYPEPIPLEISGGQSISNLVIPVKSRDQDDPPISEPGVGPVGPMALDLDAALGDQGKRTGIYPAVDDIVTIDLVATEGAMDLSGFEVSLSFDPAQLEYTGCSLMDLFAGGVPIETPGDGAIKISAVFFGTTTTEKNTGTIGQFSFEILPGYTGKTIIRIIEGFFAKEGVPQELEIGSGGAIVMIGGDAPPAPTPDFTGDGTVGFEDFLLFAGVFGAREGDGRYDRKFDLDQDGEIGFSDFLLFAGAFGKPVSEYVPPGQ